MVATNELVGYCDTVLSPSLFKDYCPNGLQVAGKPEISHIVSGVTASLALIEAAIDLKAEAILVHHGLFWNGDDPRVVGVHYQRLQSLLKAGTNVIAYHLPLDAHPVYGNNAQLGLHLGFEIDHWFLSHNGPPIGCVGHLPSPLDFSQLSALLSSRLSREPMGIDARKKSIRTIAWCTGAAQRYLAEAAALGVDAYLTGEISEMSMHLAKEASIDFFAAGHHATERYGAQALGAHLAERFGIQHTFIDIDNPA